MDITYIHISCATNCNAHYPDSTDDSTYGAVSEDGKVGERSNNNGTLDDRHGSQVRDGTNIKNVRTGLQ